MEKVFGEISLEMLKQLKLMKKSLSLGFSMHESFKIIHETMLKFINYITRIGLIMDKKMKTVTRQMKTAERDIRKGAKGAAIKALKGAEKKNEKLTKIDKEERDPKIEAYDKMKKKKH